MTNKNYLVGKAQVNLIVGDITEMSTDAIVNTANSTLLGGGGVDGAIHRRGGPKILEECKMIRQTIYPRGLPTGEAVITKAGNLKAKWVIHTVGPIWTGGKHGERELLRNAYVNSLKAAVEAGLKTISFPSISTGAYNFPTRDASKVALKAVREFLESEDNIEQVTFVLFSEQDLEVYLSSAAEIFQ